MATKAELIAGYEVLIQEARRIAASLSADQWSLSVDLDGWKGAEALAHVAGVGPLVVPMITATLNAPEGSSPLNTSSIDAINAGIVGARAGKTPPELAEEVAQAYGSVMEWVKSAGDDVLEKRVTVAGYKDLPVSDVLVRMTILHGLAHLYSVYSAVFFA
jgi:hypothetical protein